eukprot:15480176-Alexandrium_andersonii.AAC.1
MLELSRRKDESLTQFVTRRERQMVELAGHGVVIPQELQAILLEEGAELSLQGQQNLRALTAGQITLPS